MPPQTITANVPNKENPDEAQSCSVEYDFGDTAEAAIEAFGGDVVLSNFKANVVVTLQGRVRNLLKSGKTEEEIQVIISEWKPGQAAVRGGKKDPTSKYCGELENMTEEERSEALAKLKAKLAELGS